MGCIFSPKFRVIHRSLLFDAIRDSKLLREILEALTAKKEKKQSQDAPKETEAKAGGDEAERGKKDTSKETLEKHSEAISKIVSSLARLEQSHMEQNKILVTENQELNNEEVAKVAQMEDKIRSLKEALPEGEKEEVNLLNRPNPAGSTLLHVSSKFDDGETTRLLLEHGADPNLLDADGNSPLHIVCQNKDIQTASCILRNSGSILKNKKSQTPSIEELFFDQSDEDVRELIESMDQSKHRTDILNKILQTENLLFRLVEKDKSEILSIIIGKLSNAEQEAYVNLVRYKGDGNTALHLATMKKSLKSASHLLEAGAKFVTNVEGITPPIEDFFTEKNEDKITTALVDGVVERVKTKQLMHHQALKLLIPDDTRRKILFQRATVSNWGIIAEWAQKEGIDFSNVIPRMNASDLEQIVEAARRGRWEKEKVHALLCTEDRDNEVFLSRLDVTSQKEVAFWHQEKTNQIADKMGKEFIQWLVEQAHEGKWDGEELAGAFCQMNSDNKLKLATIDEELQKQLAVQNKKKTCLSVPLLGSSMQQWLYQEAEEGKWSQEMVFGVLEKQEREGDIIVSARLKNLGKEPYQINQHQQHDNPKLIFCSF